MNPMLAKPYAGQDIAGWLMSEKLDGVRAIWTGTELLSRNGNRFAAPAWFTSALPAEIPMDGELYIGRGQFQRVVGIVRTKVPVDADWNLVRYHVFDAQAHGGPFRARLAAVAGALAGNAVAAVVEHTEVADRAQLDTALIAVIGGGGEGLMLRNPASLYEQKRSANLLKLKNFDTEEAEVIGHQAGEGRLAEMVGALVCKWRDIVFNVGSGLSDCVRLTPPAIGERITFAFQGVTDGGAPRFPTFVTTRNYE